MERTGFGFRRQAQLGNCQPPGAFRGLIQTCREERPGQTLAVNLDLAVALAKCNQAVGRDAGIEAKGGVNGGTRKRERRNLDPSLQQQRDVALQSGMPDNANQNRRRFADANAVEGDVFLRIWIQGIDLIPHGGGQILVGDAGQLHLADGNLVTRQQDGGGEVAGAELLEESSVIFAPLCGRLLAKVRDAELAQHADAGRPQTDDRDG